MLRLTSYLAPSIPAGFYETIAGALEEILGLQVELTFEERISGPLAGDTNPFTEGRADLGFVCSPTYRYFADQLLLLPSPVPVDPRANGKPVYFSDIVVAPDSGLGSISDIRGCRWTYNDANSQSGWFSIIDYLAPELPGEFFAGLVHSGSHLNSLAFILDGRADAAGVDSNALKYFMHSRPDVRLKVIASLGPFPIQPVVARSGMDSRLCTSIREILLNLHRTHATEIRQYGFERFMDTVQGNYFNDHGIHKETALRRT